MKGPIKVKSTYQPKVQKNYVQTHQPIRSLERSRFLVVQTQGSRAKLNVGQVGVAKELRGIIFTVSNTCLQAKTVPGEGIPLPDVRGGHSPPVEPLIQMEAILDIGQLLEIWFPRLQTSIGRQPWIE